MLAAELIPSTAEVASAIAVWAVLLLGCGAVLGRRLLQGRSWLEVTAVTPAIGTASLFGYQQLAAVAGLRVGTATFAAWVAATAMAGCLLPSGRRLPEDGSPPPRWLGAALGATALAALAIWIAGTTGSGRLIPSETDSVRHAFFVSRIVETGSNDASRVLVDDIRSEESSASYYPLTLHTTAAVIVDATGLPVAAVLTGWAAVFATTTLVPGLALLARRLSADNAVAAVAALVGALTLPFPFDSMLWGGFPMLAGLSLVPATAVAAERWIVDRQSLGAAVAALLGCYGAHNTQALVAVALGGALCARRVRLDDALRRAATAAACVGMLAAPDLIGFALGTAERTGHQTTDTVNGPRFLWAAARFGVAWTEITPLGLFAAGLVGLVLLWRRGHGTYCVVPILLIALSCLAATSDGPVAKLATLPWYRFPNRLYDTALVLLAPAISLAVVTALRRLPHPVVLGGLLALVTIPERSSYVLHSVEVRSTIGPEQVTAFELLAERVPPGSAVLTEQVDDGGMWMYTNGGTVPLFGFPVEYHAAGPHWAASTQLLAAVADPTTSPLRVRELAQAQCVGYVFANDHPARVFDKELSREALGRASFLSVELDLPTVSVYRIDGVDLGGCSRPAPPGSTISAG